MRLVHKKSVQLMNGKPFSEGVNHEKQPGITETESTNNIARIMDPKINPAKSYAEGK